MQIISVQMSVCGQAIVLLKMCMECLIIRNLNNLLAKHKQIQNLSNQIGSREKASTGYI